MIKLEWTCQNGIANEDVFNSIYAIINNLKEEGGVFAGKKDRLDYAPYSCLITYNDNPIGFIYTAREQRYQDAYFLDMAIIKEYRGLGLGTEALNKFIEIIDSIEKKFIIGETKHENEASNPLGYSLGQKILEDRYNYYLFPKSRYAEFKEFNKDKRFEQAMARDTLNSRELLIRIYEDEHNAQKRLTK